MNGFEHVKAALNLDQIFAICAEKCFSELGRQDILNAQPSTSREELIQSHKLVNEAVEIMDVEARMPLRIFMDIRVLLNKIEPAESYLEIKECQEIQSFLEICEDILFYFKGIASKYPGVYSLVSNISSQKQIISQLQFTIEPSGTIFDNASPDLKIIRKKLSRLREEVRHKLEHISERHREHLQEDFITLRDGRLVLPVREFSVNKVPGIIHGQSSSGSTKYVEPLSVVNLNNEVQELYVEEQREIIKILKRLSKLIRNENASIIRNLNVLTQLDVLQAKGRFALELNAVFPQLSDGPLYWNLLNARHPILYKRIGKETVPLNLELGESFRMLIISGPNAGGKTVALKTLGLLQLMLQCSIPIPVDEGSVFPVCEQIFVLIGDKQSLENDLSTFSSHIQGLNHILNSVDHNALVLIDEIGIGTEPDGGAALALAVLEKLNRFGVATLVSTHQKQLKFFASQMEGVENGAMQYDIEQLKPLFFLETGVPGSSFTFDICQRYGMDETLIKRARKLETHSGEDMEKLLSDITAKSAHYQEMVRKLSLRESELNALVNLYNGKTNELKRNQRKLEKEAKEQATKIIENANREIENTIREIRESQAEKSIVSQSRKRINDLKEELNHSNSTLSKPSGVLQIGQISTGQKARSLSFNIVGRISRIFKNKNMVELEREGIKLSIDLTDLELLDENGQIIKNSSETIASTNLTPGSNVSSELDIRGYETEDGLQELDRYLDVAVHSQWNDVTIIHGKGTGALRAAVQRYLSKDKRIKGYRTGRWGEGDTGVTIVTLRESS